MDTFAKRIGSMKKKIFVILLLCVGIGLCACDSVKQREYYSHKENYIHATGVVNHIAYNNDTQSLYIGFIELSPAFDDDCFKIVGDNLLIVQKNGIDQKIEIGQRVEFITAPRYFGDGYVMPIVAISVNDEVLLEFEDGFANLQEWLSKK